MLSIVIPSYNDWSRLVMTLGECRKYLDKQGVDYELIPVSDGSTDGTSHALQVVADERIRPVVYTVNHGKGYAVRQGCLAARGEYVMFMDVDLAVPLEYLELMLELLQKYDVVIGSRRCFGARIVGPQPLARRLSGRVFNLAARALGLPYRDTQCGFKGFRREAARAIFNRAAADGFAFDVEILLLAGRLGYNVAEMGVEWRDGSKSSVSLAKGLRAFWELGSIARRARGYGEGRGFLVGQGPAGSPAPVAGEVPSSARSGL